MCVHRHTTTQALQNLRSVDDGFDAWYEPIREDMRSDPLMKFSWDLRSEILKRGTLAGLAEERRFEKPRRWRDPGRAASSNSVGTMSHSSSLEVHRDVISLLISFVRANTRS